MSKVENFKKGQIIPRRLGFLLAEVKGAQHYIRFGMDATWDGISLKPARPMTTRDFLAVIDHRISAPRKNGTRRKSGFCLSNDFVLQSRSDSDPCGRHAEIHRKDRAALERQP